MTLPEARKAAVRRAAVLGECVYVLGPCPTEGYWIAAARLRVEIWPDRAPVFTAAPDGRTSTP